MFADANLSAGADQAFPIIWGGSELTGEQNLDAAGERIAGRRSAGALAAAIKSGGKDPGVVEDQEVAGL